MSVDEHMFIEIVVFIMCIMVNIMFISCATHYMVWMILLSDAMLCPRSSTPEEEGSARAEPPNSGDVKTWLE